MPIYIVATFFHTYLYRMYVINYVIPVLCEKTRFLRIKNSRKFRKCFFLLYIHSLTFCIQFSFHFIFQKPDAGPLQRDPRKQLAKFQLDSIVVKLDMKSDNQMDAGVNLHTCLLDDLRPGAEDKITR